MVNQAVDRGEGGKHNYISVLLSNTVIHLPSCCYKTYMTFFLMRNTKKIFFKNVGNQILLVTIDFHCMRKSYFLKERKKEESHVG